MRRPPRVRLASLASISSSSVAPSWSCSSAAGFPGLVTQTRRSSSSAASVTLEYAGTVSESALVASSTEPIPTGDVSVKMLFEIDEPRPGAGGNVTLWANGKQIGEGRIDHTVAMLYTTYAGMDIGRDNGGVVDLDYEDKAPYAFTGTVKNVVFDLQPAHMEAEAALHEHRETHGVAHGIAG